MQFKKHISQLIAFFLLVSNSGLAFNVHYCGDKIAAVSSVFSNEEVCVVPVKEEKKCCAKKETSHKKCCSDKEVNLKNKAEKIVVKSITFDLHSVYYIDEWKAISFSSDVTPLNIQSVEYYCDANSPPFYKLYCQFTLFG